MNPMSSPSPVMASGLSFCPVCGGTTFSETCVLWPELVRAWELTPEEESLINRQQGFCCQGCGSNLRSMTLAAALLAWWPWPGTLHEMALHPSAGSRQILELNPAGHLHSFLSRFPRYAYAEYPEVDMQAMPYPDCVFDAVIHSDTLEHVPDPVRALAECRRILRPAGAMLMTIPIVPSKWTRRRHQLPPSYHGTATEQPEDFKVWTEYGVDFYADLFAAGWREIRLFSLNGLDSLAITGIKA